MCLGIFFRAKRGGRVIRASAKDLNDTLVTQISDQNDCHRIRQGQHHRPKPRDFSTTDQSLEIQEAALKAAGCEVIRSETRSGTTTTGRAELQTVLDFLRPGDVLMVTRIDRLARSIGDLQDIVRAVKAKGATLKATEQLIDTGTAAGKCFLDMLGVFAEFETNLRKERQLEGIAKAKAAGVYKGRPASIDPAQVQQLRVEAWDRHRWPSISASAAHQFIERWRADDCAPSASSNMRLCRSVVASRCASLTIVRDNTSIGTTYRAAGSIRRRWIERPRWRKPRRLQGLQRTRVLNDCNYGQSHLGSEVGGEQYGQCSGAENTGGDECGHLNLPPCCRREGEPGLFQDCFM